MWAMFGLFTLELLRFYLSRGYHRSVRDEKEEYARLLESEEAGERQKQMQAST
jgi:hypothetical protein